MKSDIFKGRSCRPDQPHLRDFRTNAAPVTDSSAAKACERLLPKAYRSGGRFLSRCFCDRCGIGIGSDFGDLRICRSHRISYILKRIIIYYSLFSIVCQSLFIMISNTIPSFYIENSKSEAAAIRRRNERSLKNSLCLVSCTKGISDC